MRIASTVARGGSILETVLDIEVGNTMSKARVLALLIALPAAQPGPAAAALAQKRFPSRPIDVVTHASPGGGSDSTARTILIGAREALGVDMAVLPKTGGGGLIAMHYVNSRPRDGHTVMGITPTHLLAIARGQGPLQIDDLVPIVRATDDPIVVTVRDDARMRTLAGLIRLGRRRPIKWGTTQIGGIDHVAGEMLARSAETELSVVPFSGGGEIVTNLLGGNIDAAGLNLTEGLDAIRRGDFRALAVMADRRVESLPEVPTTVELGYDVVFSTVRGYVVLKGTPEDRVQILERAMLEAMKHPAYQNYLRGAGLDSDSIGGREAWGAQINRLYRDARQAMLELGMIQP